MNEFKYEMQELKIHIARGFNLYSVKKKTDFLDTEEPP